MEFSNLTSKYGTVADMMTSKAFYGELMSMPSLVNLSAQIAQFAIYYRHLDKVVEAKSGEDNKIDFGSAMITMMGPFAAAGQIFSPLVKAEKRYDMLKEQ